jgi:hypothetical protein
MSNDPIKQSALDHRPSISGRCVEITTDEQGSILIAFVAVGPQTVFITTLNQPEKGKLP